MKHNILRLSYDLFAIIAEEEFKHIRPKQNTRKKDKKEQQQTITIPWNIRILIIVVSRYSGVIMLQ